MKEEGICMGGVGLESGILPKPFMRSDIPDGAEVLGRSESRTTNIDTVQEPTRVAPSHSGCGRLW